MTHIILYRLGAVCYWAAWAALGGCLTLVYSSHTDVNAYAAAIHLERALVWGSSWIGLLAAAYVFAGRRWYQCKGAKIPSSRSE